MTGHTENAEQKRVEKMFWVNHEGVVKHVKGYECTPCNPGYYWMPEVGYSQGEKFLFDNEADARKAAIKTCREHISRWEQKLEVLK